MTVYLAVRNESLRKGLYRTAQLRKLALEICAGEAISHDIELSLLFCDDRFITDLNQQYRKKKEPTDVLSFAASMVQQRPDSAVILGDIVISLETVERRHPKEPRCARQEVRLLFCHGLLHLLGYTHQKAAQRRIMAARQARYLKWSPDAAWPADSDSAAQCDADLTQRSRYKLLRGPSK